MENGIVVVPWSDFVNEFVSDFETEIVCPLESRVPTHGHLCHQVIAKSLTGMVHPADRISPGAPNYQELSSGCRPGAV